MITILSFILFYMFIVFLFIVILKICYKKKFKTLKNDDKEEYNDDILMYSIFFPFTIIIVICMSPYLIGKYIIKIIDEYYGSTK